MRVTEPLQPVDSQPREPDYCLQMFEPKFNLHRHLHKFHYQQRYSKYKVQQHTLYSGKYKDGKFGRKVFKAISILL